MKRFFSNNVIVISMFCSLFYFSSACASLEGYKNVTIAAGSQKKSKDSSSLSSRLSSTEQGRSSFLITKKSSSETKQTQKIEKSSFKKKNKDNSLPKIKDNLFFGNPKYESIFQFKQKGIASWCSNKFNGKLTANGEIYDSQQMTAAHRTIPFGSLVEVTDVIKNISILVRINDRGPSLDGRIINLSYLAAKNLGIIKSGLAKVKIRIISSDYSR